MLAPSPTRNILPSRIARGPGIRGIGNKAVRHGHVGSRRLAKGKKREEANGHGGGGGGGIELRPDIVRHVMTHVRQARSKRGETTRCSLRRVSAMETPLVLQLSHPARLRGAESGTA